MLVRLTLVDVSTIHSIMGKSKETTRDRQIVGFSLSPTTAAAVKMEAARRKLTLRKLFEEMWADYAAKNKPK